ncbi:TatD family hydrolase [Mycoplasma struthionis]|uniref:TatD family hydrolase n=1 Tax=Mycoplasma struthionis TaxID=538220 RepID=UPI002FE421AD
MYGAIGIHPNDAKGKEDGEFLKKYISNKIVAIGEVGLDYHYDDSLSKEIQKESFLAQIEVAKENNLVVMLHIREALEDAFEIITRPEYKDVIFVFHSYSGDYEFTKKCLAYENINFSFSGVITFKNAKSLQATLPLIPLNRITCETDTPYLTPTPFRGTPNISPYVKYVYEYIANYLNIDLEEFVNQVRKNIERIYKI